jgi:23S rRNA (guanosine2251-2'-O)-methyltransferase
MREHEQPTSDRLVVGLQPVREALRVHGARVAEVLIESKSNARLDALARFAVDRGATTVRRGPRRDLDRLSGGVSHQGAAARVPRLTFHALETILEEPALLAVATDGIQDPHNFGAVVRSAVGLGSAAVLWAEHASAPLSLATFRASAGAIEHARLCRVPSLRQALTELGAHGIQVVGLDGQAHLSLSQLDLTEATVLVVGSEHRGITSSVRRSCSHLARLAGMSTIDSLNASVAAGIALYEARNQRLESKH